jgi:preprotein translocase subunit YajC
MLNNIVILAQQAPPPGAAGEGAPPQWVGMLPIFVIFGVMIFFMMRSQKKQAQKRKEMLNSIKAGDKIITNGGIKGTIEKVKDDAYMLKIADGVQIEIVHAAVGQIVGKDNNE